MYIAYESAILRPYCTIPPHFAEAFSSVMFKTFKDKLCILIVRVFLIT